MCVSTATPLVRFFNLNNEQYIQNWNILGANNFKNILKLKLAQQLIAFMYFILVRELARPHYKLTFSNLNNENKFTKCTVTLKCTVTYNS